MPSGTRSSKNSKIYGDGPLKKASLIVVDEKDKKKVNIPVQFNPNSYSISRGVESKVAKGNAENPETKDLKATQTDLATLSLELIVDADFEEERGLNDAVADYFRGSNVTKYLQTLAMVTKMDYKSHTVSYVIFSWGSLYFKGMLTSLNMRYDLFDRDGKPVRARVSISIKGEENAILSKQLSSPFESPDRTKFRMLGQADELWMMAYQEYSDPSDWREIAKENGILNPRKVDYTKMLKIPSI